MFMKRFAVGLVLLAAMATQARAQVAVSDAVQF
jgi:hypothetical protein